MKTSDQPLGNLAVAICTKNNERTIGRCLDSVRSLVRDIVVVDSGSDDRTLEMCRAAGARVLHREWSGIVEQRRYAMNACEGAEWVLALDSDEALEPDLRRSVRRALSEPDNGIHGYEINRRLWLFGAWLSHTAQPEWRLRLVRQGAWRVCGLGPPGRERHDRIEVDGPVVRLSGVCRHDSWPGAAEILTSGTQTAIWAVKHDSRPTSTVRMLTSPLGHFLKNYLIKGGFRDGRRGLLACLGMAYGTFARHYLKNARRLEAKEDPFP